MPHTILSTCTTYCTTYNYHAPWCIHLTPLYVCVCTCIHIHRLPCAVYIHYTISIYLHWTCTIYTFTVLYTCYILCYSYVLYSELHAPMHYAGYIYYIPHYTQLLCTVMHILYHPVHILYTLLMLCIPTVQYTIN